MNQLNTELLNAINMIDQQKDFIVNLKQKAEEDNSLISSYRNQIQDIEGENEKLKRQVADLEQLNSQLESVTDQAIK